MEPCAARYYYAPGYLAYDFGPSHPLHPARLAALLDLAKTAGLLDGPDIEVVAPTPATRDELELVHAPAYLDTVAALGAGAADRARAAVAGLGPGDTPAFAGMFDVAALIAGGTLAAARAVMRGETRHAFNPGGGLHHAHRDRASGFCIFNDLAVAIASIAREHEAKVMYVDLDVHHGDGVQAAFYDDPRVLTVSFHETGKYLFPGGGNVLETGAGAGVGYNVNVPLAPFTQDASWLTAVETLLPALAEKFAPDLIVSQFGCDAHTWDEQAHLRLTTAAYARAAALVHTVAHSVCGGRWVATGGGGYDPIRVVPRAWALVWAEMAGRPAPELLPRDWLARWTPLAAEPMPERFIDPPEIAGDVPRRPIIERENDETVARVRGMALSPQLRQLYRPNGPWTPPTLGDLPIDRTARIELPRGPLHLRDRCPASSLRRMRVAAGMQAFSRSAEREALLLQRIAARPENNLVIAHTPDGEIVAELTLAPADGRWYGQPGIYEAALEVAPSWRGVGLAEALLHFAFEADYLERLVVMALGLSWHWDLRGGRTASSYRETLIRVFGAVGFQVYDTDDPEITRGEANVLLARIGSQTSEQTRAAFEDRLYVERDWMGMMR